jgi:hypothetical protein
MPARFQLPFATHLLVPQIAFTDMALFMVKIASDEELWRACCGKAVQVTY